MPENADRHPRSDRPLLRLRRVPQGRRTIFSHGGNRFPPFRASHWCPLSRGLPPWLSSPDGYQAAQLPGRAAARRSGGLSRRATRVAPGEGRGSRASPRNNRRDHAGPRPLSPDACGSRNDPAPTRTAGGRARRVRTRRRPCRDRSGPPVLRETDRGLGRGRSATVGRVGQINRINEGKRSRLITHAAPLSHLGPTQKPRRFNRRLG
jgi:hypothetical protein